MSRSISRLLLTSFAILCALALVLSAPPTFSQGTVGTVSITVLDQSGAFVPGASLSLKDLATNNVLTGKTAHDGTFTFASVNFGTYSLTITKESFATQVLSSVIVQTGRVTPVKVTLRVGAASEQVVVTAEASPIIETNSNTLGTTIDMKQINDLPLEGRDVSQLVFLTPGYTGIAGYGTWNGLPVIAQSNTVDGVVSNSNRMKFDGNATPAMQARLEDIGEMTVQTGQQDLNQGYGEASMGASYTTRRGSNSYHGGVFEDFRNSAMNANSWDNNAIGARRNPLIRNEFGGNAGGPILKDKLFFFGSFSTSKQPGGRRQSRTFLSPTAQTGVYTMHNEKSTNGFTNGQTIDLFGSVAAPAGLPAAVNNPAAPPACPPTEVPCPNNTWGSIAAEIARVNKALTNQKIVTTGDPNTESVNWFVSAPYTYYFPAFRLDYNATRSFRLNWAFEETRENHPGSQAPYFPGPDFGNQLANFYRKNYTSSIGFEWTISPSVVNSFTGGYLYTSLYFGRGATPLWSKQPVVSWALGNSGQQFNLATSQYYPTVSGTDTLTWLRGSHTLDFGFSYAREQDHYYNAPDGIPRIFLGLANGDPALGTFNAYFAKASPQDRREAGQLYATLVGRISSVGPTGSGFPFDPATGGYSNVPGQTVNLDELQRSWGLFAGDAYHVLPSLTLNYGLRWDFIGDDHDLAHQYLGTPLDSVWGPSGIGNIFNPGVEFGTNTPVFVAQGHQYNPWDVTPQPSLGVAWNPNYSQGWLSKLFGGGKTVIRAGFDIKRFTEPNQFFWNFGTNHGIGYFQHFALRAAGGGGTGTFTPGSLTLGTLFGDNTSIPYVKAPPFYQRVVPMTDFTWNYFWGLAGFDPNIKQPYVQEWNLGIQREITHSNVLEVRYVGHRSVHQWLAVDPNEVNIFENRFLNEFKNAQTNLAINKANGITSFADNGYSGQVALPIFNAAFAGEPSGGAGVPFEDYGNFDGFIDLLNQGQAGALAAQLAYPFGPTPGTYICNLVGSSLTPCANGSFASFTTPGQYPANFFQANPYGASFPGVQQEFMSNGGWGNYNALQVDFRQRPWHGTQFDANYTWSHTLGIQPDTQWLGTFNQFTMRNLRLSYGPTLFDLRQVVHVSGTYDFPLGSGKAFLNRKGLVDRIAGGWTLGTIFQYETGFPLNLNGGFQTFNDYADGGLVLQNGLTLKQLQNAVGVYHPKPGQYPGLPLGDWAYTINPKYLAAANASYTPPANCFSGLVNVCQNTTPGTVSSNFFLYGPHIWNTDMSLSKSVPIRENLRFLLQAEFLNVFNHPEWANPDANIFDGTSVGQAGTGGFSGARFLELRARLDF